MVLRCAANMVKAKAGEMFLNESQQRNLFDAIDSGGFNGSAQPSIQVNIESFDGSESNLDKLENMLIELQSNNRIAQVV